MFINGKGKTWHTSNNVIERKGLFFASENGPKRFTPKVNRVKSLKFDTISNGPELTGYGSVQHDASVVWYTLE